MLALTDEALSRVAIAATGVAPASRAAWLENLAARLEQEPAPAPSPGARYTARWRQRRRAGRILLHIEADEAALVVALIDHNALDPLQADDPVAITAAVQSMVESFCETSPPAPQIGDKLCAGLIDGIRRRRLGAGIRLRSSAAAGARAPKQHRGK